MIWMLVLFQMLNVPVTIGVAQVPVEDCAATAVAASWLGAPGCGVALKHARISVSFG